MKCIYCDKLINTYSFKSIFLKEDFLCVECREKLVCKKKVMNINGYDIEIFYKYDGMFKNLLIQYKECYDEALKDVFLYDIKEYIEFKYHDYYLCLVPSSQNKLKQRGFNHLELICKNIKLKRIKLKMINDISQQNKNYNDRKLMENNFVYSGEKVDKVLIFDDVLTTGSSITGAINALKPYTSKIKIIVLSAVQY